MGILAEGAANARTLGANLKATRDELFRALLGLTISQGLDLSDTL